MLIVLGLVWLAPQDAFVAERDAAAASNKGSAGFTIAFADARRAFHPGEAIPLVFSYDQLYADPHHYDDLSQRGPVEVILDHADGTARPQTDYERALIYEPRGVCCGVPGGLAGGETNGSDTIGLRWDGTQVVPIPAPPRPPPPKPPPLTVTVVLNQIVRFDAAAHYRIYVMDRHQGEIGGHRDPHPPPLVSNILEIDITARDAAWEDRTASEAIGVLASSSEAAARTEAARTLRFLGTDRAVDEMVVGLNRWSANEESREDNSQYVRGLFSARDRPRAIARLEAAVDDPRQPVSWLHLITLAALRMAATEPPPGAFNPAHKPAALNALVARRQRSLHRAEILADGLSASFDAYAPVPEGEVRPARHVMPAFVSPVIAEFPGEVETALSRLPPATQRAVLADGQSNFLDRRFIPMLERFAGAGPDGPAEPAIEILIQIAPTVARRIILNDLARPKPRLGIATTGLLADPVLPALDAAFARQLSASADSVEFAAAMDRVGRYATRSIVRQVEQAYVRHPDAHSCEIAVPALAYFFRADPAFARQQMLKMWSSLEERDVRCEYGDTRGLFPSVAAAGWSRTLEDAAIATLRSPDAALVADAAAMLAGSISPRPEEPLWQALEAWHGRWSERKAFLYEEASKRSWDATLSENLGQALSSAVGWRLDDAGYRRLKALCLATCGDILGHRENAGELSIVVRVEARAPRRTYLVDEVWLDSLAELQIKLLQFPPGTSFKWYGEDRGRTGWDLDLPDQDFAQIDRFLRAHGMHLQR